MAGIYLEFAKNRLGRNPAVIRQHDDMLTVIGDRVGVRGVDDDRPIMAELFLKARVAVIPIGPRLDDRKFVNEGRSGPDPWKADARKPAHLEGQDQPVPVDRTVLRPEERRVGTERVIT